MNLMKKTAVFIFAALLINVWIFVVMGIWMPDFTQKKGLNLTSIFTSAQANPSTSRQVASKDEEKKDATDDTEWWKEFSEVEDAEQEAIEKEAKSKKEESVAQTTSSETQVSVAVTTSNEDIAKLQETITRLENKIDTLNEELQNHDEKVASSVGASYRGILFSLKEMSGNNASIAESIAALEKNSKNATDNQEVINQIAKISALVKENQENVVSKLSASFSEVIAALGEIKKNQGHTQEKQNEILDSVEILNDPTDMMVLGQKMSTTMAMITEIKEQMEKMQQCEAPKYAQTEEHVHEDHLHTETLSAPKRTTLKKSFHASIAAGQAKVLAAIKNAKKNPAPKTASQMSIEKKTVTTKTTKNMTQVAKTQNTAKAQVPDIGMDIFHKPFSDDVLPMPDIDVNQYQGTVLVALSFDEAGKAHANVKKSSGNEELDKKVVEIMNSKWKSPKRSGLAYELEMAFVQKEETKEVKTEEENKTEEKK